MVEPTDRPVEPTDALEFRETEAEQQAVVREAIASRPEVQAVGWNEKIYDEAIGIYKADMQPRLDFNGAYGWSVREPSNFFESNYKKWSLAVTLKVPVFDGWRTAGKVAQARADRAKVGQDRVALETLIDLEAKQAVDRLRVAASVFHAAELNVTQARKAQEMTEANYRLGAATTLDVLDAQAALTQAEFNRIEALHAHANARAGLRYVMGQDPLEEAAARTRPPRATDAGARPGRGRVRPEHRRPRLQGTGNAMNTRHLLLAAALLPLAACTGSKADPASQAPLGLAVRTAAVQKRDLPEDVVLTGTLKPRAQVQVVAEVQARLLRVLRDEGSRVAKGDVLAVLDETDYRLANDRARAALAMAEANRAHAQTEKERADNLLKTGGITDRDHLSAQVALQVADAGARPGPGRGGDRRASRSRRTQVRAPFAGRVARRFPDPGAMLVPRHAALHPRGRLGPRVQGARPVAGLREGQGRGAGRARHRRPRRRSRRRAASRGSSRSSTSARARSRSWSRCPAAPTSSAACSPAPRCASARWKAPSWSRPPRSCATARDPTKAEVFVARGGQGREGER